MKKYFLYALMAAASARAGIEWKQTEATLEVHPTQVYAEAVFVFTNTGNEAISFSDVQVSCGCLSVKPLNPGYGPGETGHLVVRYSLRNREGPQSKSVWVETSDGQRTELSISGNIPQAYVVESKLLNWRKGDEAGQKTIRLTNPNAMPIKLLSIASSHKGLPAVLKTIREGYEYEVVVTRKPDAVNARSVLRIATEPPPGQTESKSINLYVFAQ